MGNIKTTNFVPIPQSQINRQESERTVDPATTKETGEVATAEGIVNGAIDGFEDKGNGQGGTGHGGQGGSDGGEDSVRMLIDKVTHGLGDDDADAAATTIAQGMRQRGGGATIRGQRRAGVTTGGANPSAQVTTGGANPSAQVTTGGANPSAQVTTGGANPSAQTFSVPAGLQQEYNNVKAQVDGLNGSAGGHRGRNLRQRLNRLEGQMSQQSLGAEYSRLSSERDDVAGRLERNPRGHTGRNLRQRLTRLDQQLAEFKPSVSTGGANPSAQVSTGGANPSAQVSTGGANPSAQVSTGGANPSAQVSTGGANPSAQVSTGGANPSAQVTTGGANPSAQVSTGGANPSAQVSTGGANPSAQVSTGGANPSAQVTTGGANPSAQVSTGGANPSAQVSTGGANPSAQVTTGGANPSAQVSTGGANPSAQVTTGGANPSAQVTTGGANPSAQVSTGGANPSAQVTTGGANPSAQVTTGGANPSAQVKRGQDAGAGQALNALPDKGQINGQQFEQAIVDGTKDLDNQAAGAEFADISGYTQENWDRMSPDARQKYRTYERYAQSAQAKGNTGIATSDYKKMQGDLQTAGYRDQGAGQAIETLQPRPGEAGQTITGPQMRDAILAGTSDLDNRAAGAEYQDFKQFAGENWDRMSPDAQGAFRTYEGYAEAAQKKGKTGIPTSEYSKMEAELAQVGVKDQSAAEALGQLPTKGELTAEQFETAIIDGTKDLDGQAAGAEFEQIQEYATQNWDRMSPDARQRYRTYEGYAEQAQARGSDGIRTSDFERMKGDMAGSSYNDAGAAAAIETLQPRPGEEGKVISGQQMEQAILQATEDLDNQAAGAEFKDLQRFATQNWDRMSPDAREKFRTYEGYAETAQKAGNTGIRTSDYSQMKKDMAAAGYADQGMATAVETLQDTQGTISGEQMQRAILEGSQDLDGNAAGGEFKDLQEFATQNWDRLSPDAQDKFRTYERFAKQAQARGSDGIRMSDYNQMKAELKTTAGYADASAGVALEKLRTTEGTISGDAMYEAIVSGTADFDGQTAGTEYADFRRFAEQNWDRMSYSARSKFQTYEQYSQAHQAVGKDGMSDPVYQRMVKDMQVAGSAEHLPFFNAETGGLDANKIAEQLQAGGLSGDASSMVAEGLARNVSPQQFYQGFWNAAGGRGTVNLDQLGQNFRPQDDGALTDELLKRANAQSLGLDAQRVGRRQARVSTGGANPSAQVTTGGANPSAQVTTGGANPSAQVTTGGANPSAQTHFPEAARRRRRRPVVTSGGANPSAQVSTGGANPSAQVSTGGANPSAQVSTGGANPSAQVSTGGANPSAQVSTGGANPSAQVTTGGANPSGQVTTGGANPSAQVTTGGANPSSQVTTGGANPSGQVTTGPANPSGQVTTGPANPSGQVTTGPANPSGQVTTGPANPSGQVAGTPLDLNRGQSRIAAQIYGDGAKVRDMPGAGQGQISAGDIIALADGQEITLTREKALEFNQRANVVENALEHGAPWKFTGNRTPRMRDDRGRAIRFDKDADVQPGDEIPTRGGEPNPYWRYVAVGGQNAQGEPTTSVLLQVRPDADPAKAVQDMYDNPERYNFDCATAVRVLNLKATLDTVGADDFNTSHSPPAAVTGLALHGHYDSTDNREDYGMMDIQAFGEPTVTGGVQEWPPFDPASGDKLVPGDWRYFESTGDTTSMSQGWNAVYLGRDDNGNHQFWKIDGGKGTFTVNDRLSNGPSDHLSAIRGSVDINGLLRADQTAGVD